MEIVPYTTTGNVKEMCKFHEHRKCTEYLLEISKYLNVVFLPVLSSYSTINYSKDLPLSQGIKFE